MLNGTVKIRGRKLPIFWSGEFAQHVAENYYNKSDSHPFLHVEVQKLLQTCSEFKKSGKSIVGILNKNGSKIYVVFFIRSKFAVIKTCYIYAS